MTAQEYYHAITTNVDAFYQNSISYEVFHERAMSLWGDVQKAGLNDQVTAIIRQHDPYYHGKQS